MTEHTPAPVFEQIVAVEMADIDDLGHVNNIVYLPPYELHLKNTISSDANAAPDGKGGTLVTVHVHVPTKAHVVSTEYRYQVSSQKDGYTLITLYLDVPIS